MVHLLFFIHVPTLRFNQICAFTALTIRKRDAGGDCGSA